LTNVVRRVPLGSAVKGKATAVMVSQGVVAGSSLVLQVFASRKLGSAGLGRFSLLVAILITLNSVQSGWIGDSLTVLDRFEPGVRRALFTYQCWALVIVGGVGFGLAFVIQGIGVRNAMLFGLACLLWAAEETGRRLLIARRDFWPLAVNDVAYMVGAFGYVGVVAVVGRVTLGHLIAALGAGALAAILVATGHDPPSPRRAVFRARSAVEDLRALARRA
jgi:hypothetical protein